MAKLFPKWLYSFIFPSALYESFSGGWFPFVFWSGRQLARLRIKYGRGMHVWGGAYSWSAPGRRGLHLRKNAYSLISQQEFLTAYDVPRTDAWLCFYPIGRFKRWLQQVPKKAPPCGCGVLGNQGDEGNAAPWQPLVPSSQSRGHSLF